jgi:hypothetical protein
MSRNVAWISIGVLALLGATAHAADHGVYIGAAVSQSSIDVDLSGSSVPIPIDKNNTRYKLIGGFRPIDWFAVEVNYVDFGSVGATVGNIHGEFKLTGFDGFAMGMFAISFVDLYAKVGVVNWNQDVRITNIASASDSGNDFAYGAGIQLRFGSLAGRLEYEKFDIPNSSTSMVSLGLTWTFF